MVLGLRNKNRRSPSVQVDYLIHIQEIKPWPPSQSQRNLRAVVVQWEHGERTSGCTNQVVPSIGTGAGVGDGRIEFNESFRLPVTLLRELSNKGRNGDSFQKNCIEFNLYEPRREKTLKGQLLGSAVLDLADYGVTIETLRISVPINCKRSYRNTVQPLLFLKIEPIEKHHARSSSKDSLARELSMEDGAESVSKLMNEEYADEAEVASFTDDDVSSHSSLVVSFGAVEANGGSPCEKLQNGPDRKEDITGGDKAAHAHPLEEEPVNSDMEATESLRSLDASSRSSSIDLSSDLVWNSRRIGGSKSSVAVSKEPERKQHIERENIIDIQEQKVKEQGIYVVNGTTMPALQNKEGSVSNSSLSKDTYLDSDLQMVEKLKIANSVKACATGSDNNMLPTSSRAVQEDTASNVNQSTSVWNEKIEKKQEWEQQEAILEERSQFDDKKPLDITSLSSTTEQITSESNAPLLNREDLVLRQDRPTIDTSKQLRSVRSGIDSNRINGSVRNNQFVPPYIQSGLKGNSSFDRKDAKLDPKDTRNIIAESKIRKLETNVKTLEGELREAAALEVSLYSIVAEHGSSINKVHAPARRLARLYHHASEENSQLIRGSSAKSSVSGLVLVAKACGNDVPRLTFWLSNSIVLRAIVTKSFNEQLSSGTTGGGANDNKRKKNIAPIKWGSLPGHQSINNCDAALDDWEDPRTFVVALEKVEAWIFSRIVESIWWQTLTPHMQSGAAKSVRHSMPSELNKVNRRTSTSSEQEHVNLSLELWKRAFKDACERICPVRAAGHECGCLPVLSRLIMGQCVARLDVAMFNAILRESADEIPTDPVSDPISDTEVLPILAGKASFGAGAQLKNAIGNWSRWLTDLFDIDDDDSREEESSSDHNSDEVIKEPNGSTKSFPLLNTLSDLMMLPKDILLSKTVREEVCPLFGPQVIKRVLNAFVPDEFCPDPVPEVVLEALNSEDVFVDEQDPRVNFPCMASPISYVPPLAASISVVGNAGSLSQLRRSRSSVLKRSYTSDDELDELDSPLSSIVGSLIISPSSSNSDSMAPSESGKQNALRYRLLREVWRKD